MTRTRNWKICASSVTNRPNGVAPLSPELDSAVRGVAAQIDKIRTRELAKNAREAKAKAHVIATANALVQQCRRNVREARQRGFYAITDEQSRAAKKEAALSRANRQLATARDAMRRVFGDPGDIWPKDEIDDAREQSDLFRTFDRAFELGGAEQLEVAMERVTEQEFVEYIRGNDAALHSVLASDKLGRQF